MQRVIVATYHEISLKGRNRSFFERALIENIRRMTGLERIRAVGGRLLMDLENEVDFLGIEEKLKKIFGLAFIALATLVSARQSMEQLAEAIWEQMSQREYASFRVDANRVDKAFPLSSSAINEKVGAFLREQSGTRVDLSHPELTVYIDVLPQGVFFYFDRVKGAGGLPAGVSGDVVSLLSGGFDSPVASWQLMRRGARVIFIHFHSWPQTSMESQEVVKEIVRNLSAWQFGSRLWLVPFLEVQKEIVRSAPPSLRVVLYRRFMIRLAEMIAEREGAKALVTGDSLGQVASQTLENLSVISRVTTMPILRPLVGLDKEDIIAMSREIGLYELSSQPFDDCCSLFVPEHPETRSKLSDVVIFEDGLKVKKHIDQALEQAQIIEIAN